MGPFLIFAGVGAADVVGRQVLGVCVVKMVCVAAQGAGFHDLRLSGKGRVRGGLGALWQGLAAKGM